MTEMDDLQLLRQYAEQRSEEAFAELVKRHVNLVYSTALRLIRERELAEDVAQVVFIKLASKAGSIKEGTVLSGWLYRTTQFVGETVLRSEWRRRKREEMAMHNRELDAEGGSVWKEVAPLLEEAMAQLPRSDQDAVLLRFFEGRSLREVGQGLGISDDAAQKRVNRALEKMRDYFARGGVAANSTIIASAIAAHSVQPAPAALIANLMGGATGAGISGAAAAILKSIVIAKVKVAAIAGLVAALLVGGVVVIDQTLSRAKSRVQTTPVPAPGSTLHGIVRTSDGKPLAGALVRLATPQTYVRLYVTSNSSPAAVTNSGAGKPLAARARNQAQFFTTGTDGAFTFGLPGGLEESKMAVVATSDEGYSLVTADELLANPDVIVQPWGRIEGVLRVGKERATNQTVSIGIWGADALYEWNLVNHGASVKTDEQGRFVFARVAPGDFWLTRQVEVRPKDWRQSGHRWVKVHPGETVQVQLGGMGCPLVGQVVSDSLEKLTFYGSMWAQNHAMRTPRDWREWSNEERRKYERQWRESPEGERFKREVRNYEFAVQPDGSFRVEDVVPGIYHMQVRADGPAVTGKGMRNVAVAEMQVEVAEIPNGRTDEPFDVGTLTAPSVAKR